MSLHSRHRRRGFTLVELLVVIGIISVLMTISLLALGNAIGTAREKATISLITRLNGLLQDRMDAFERGYDRTNLAPLLYRANARFGGTNKINQAATETLKVFVRKDLQRIMFPQAFDDVRIVNTADSTTWPLNPITSQANVDLSKHTADTESSECLYYFLTKSQIFGVPPVDASTFKSSEVADTDGDGLLEFIDGWGQPLRFFRWPTRAIKPDGATINRTFAMSLFLGLPPAPTSNGDLDPLSKDADDPIGRLSQLVTQNPTLFGNGQLENRDYINDGISIAYYHQPDAFHAPLIVSAGPDKTLGMWEPNAGSSGTFHRRLGLIYLTDSAGAVIDDPNINTTLTATTFNIGSHAIIDNITNQNRKRP